jgi:surfactin synthase thioesterase subunit
MTGSARGDLVKIWRPVTDPAARLYAFPHAGGGTLALRRFCGAAPGWLEVKAIRLGGRERRLDQPSPRSLDEAMAEVGEALADDGDRCPAFWFGACSGAVLALEMACRASGAAGVGLVVTSCPAPGPGGAAATAAEEPGSVLRTLRELGGLSPEVAASPEALELFLPAVLADQQLAGQFSRPELPQLSVPILAVRGTADPAVSAAEMRAWAAHTSADTRLARVDGGHFLLSEAPEAVAAETASFILPLLDKRPAGH